ncbi:hypothetical protein M404DRAFT_1003799 [Pisolithus tinctorius Marx 270]|uniref:Uncharacterized protein n=1 Tax=Pisolithus tinctorius Marx 270 TaxID=870435 RepID=A0A0C3NZI8_PISTI|nr:hypothetical protein M404DRAFT_1003799 [Pisolithus tinctorius Marx 270]
MKTLRRAMISVAKQDLDSLLYELVLWFPFVSNSVGIMADGGGCMLMCSLPPCWTGAHRK